MADTLYLKQRHQTWYVSIDVPKEAQAFLNKKKIVVSLKTRDLTLAQTLRWEHVNNWKKRFAAIRNGSAAYNDQMAKVTAEDFTAHSSGDPDEDKELAFELEAARLEDEAIRSGWKPGSSDEDSEPLPADIKARVDAMNDAREGLHGKPATNAAKYAEPFSDTAKAWLADWKARATREGKKLTTIPQKEAIIRLFTGYWSDKPLAAMKYADGPAFKDFLMHLNRDWCRTPDDKFMTFEEIKRTYYQSGEGISTSTINRHLRNLSAIWVWAKRREKVSGQNPFEGLTEAVKDNPYLPWDIEELKKMAAHRPVRQDVYEIIQVALFSGMRINEICALTWEDLKQDQSGIWYFDIPEAKTEAGCRQVPVHSALSWLTERQRADHQEPLWPYFNPTKRGVNRPGDDASAKFSDYARKLGFDSRRKVFHSFRKNITNRSVEARIAETEWQDIIGHEKGLTHGTYNPLGLSLKLKHELIEKIEYPGLSFPRPNEVYTKPQPRPQWMMLPRRAAHRRKLADQTE